ncbi:Putative transposase OS=Eoetvoesiella caeni OX=645616 GN=DFR37_1491 PE=4 SV=1 [Eoetvoesiella caeni]
MKSRWPIRAMCRVLQVSDSGYFSWQRRQSSALPMKHQRRVSDEWALATIRAIHVDVKREYGWPRMHQALLQRGLRIGKERVRLLMKRHAICATGKRRFVATTDSKHGLPVSPNLVQRQFNADAPDQLWCGDITYLPTQEGWLYLAAVIDLFNRQIVGWSIKPHMQTSLVKDALTMAYMRRQPAPGLIFHSDRGTQYCSREFQQTLSTWQIRSSMSRKGDCWDNAPIESFWARLKLASLEGKKFSTHQAASAAVMDWITFYNHGRLHSALGYLSPMQYQQQWLASQYKTAA